MNEQGITRATYDAASTHFDAAALGFWERYGHRTIARLDLAEGARVLDVCCGTGSSAIHAARAVGPKGSVVGMDISNPLLRKAREKAARQGLTNIEFRAGDMTKLDLADASFDAVVIVFGIFFAPNMAEQVRALLRLVRPGGVLAITTWGPRLFDPLYAPFLDAIRARRPGIEDYRPWDRLTTESDLATLMRDAGVGGSDYAIVSDEGREPIARPEDWWTIVLGTGLRWFIDGLDPEGVEQVKAETLTHARDVRAIETNVIYTTINRT